MALKHIVNWDNAYHNITSQIDFVNWNLLKQEYGDKSFTRMSLILRALQKDYNSMARSLNRLLRNDGLSIPMGQYFTIRNGNPSLSSFLYALYKSCKTHSAYALLATRVATEFFELEPRLLCNIGVGEYNGEEFTTLGLSLPPWLCVILDRQKHLALQAGMDDNDPLFFVMRWTDVKKSALRVRGIKTDDPEIVDALYTFRMRYGYAINTYITNFATFAGMQNDAILQVLPPEYTGTKFQFENPHSKRSVYGKLVEIYEYNESRRTVCDFGYIIWGKEGLYLVHSNKGLVWCPYYLLGQPTVRPNRSKDNQLKLDLYKLGYYPKEFYENINDHKTLRSHTIELRKLTYESES